MAKALIIHPDLRRLGGIEAYYIKLRPHFSTNPEYFAIARRPGETGKIRRILRIANDYHRFWAKLSDPSVNIVHINPSLELKSFVREGIFLLLARLRRKKTLVFFRGWSLSFQHKIDGKLRWLFNALYGKADAFIVLASSFAESLRHWGITQPIYNEVTIIDDHALENIDLDTIKGRLADPVWELLFISRLMPAKGIFTAIKAVEIAQRTHPEVGLYVAGDGESADEAQALAQHLKVKNIHFLGVVTGKEKYKLFHSAHALFFPTEHAEGFPNTIVEAMAFGLPIITRTVGGISDFFVSGTHGYITESTSPEVFAQLIIRTIEEPERYQQISKINHQYAKDNFLASNAAERLEQIYASL